MQCFKTNSHGVEAIICVPFNKASGNEWTAHMVECDAPDRKAVCHALAGFIKNDFSQGQDATAICVAFLYPVGMESAAREVARQSIVEKIQSEFQFVQGDGLTRPDIRLVA
tara:strand:+ start:899 stop:1231 length:333 start_codon:yes stop_codon:yes gene_type:complete